MTDLLNDIYTDGCKAKKYRLSDFFNRWWDEYAQHPAEYMSLNKSIILVSLFPLFLPLRYKLLIHSCFNCLE